MPRICYACGERARSGGAQLRALNIRFRPCETPECDGSALYQVRESEPEPIEQPSIDQLQEIQPIEECSTGNLPRAGTMAARILQVIGEVAMGASEIGAIVGLHHNEVGAHLHELLTRHIVRRIRRGVYEAADPAAVLAAYGPLPDDLEPDQTPPAMPLAGPPAAFPQEAEDPPPRTGIRPHSAILAGISPFSCQCAECIRALRVPADEELSA